MKQGYGIFLILIIIFSLILHFINIVEGHIWGDFALYVLQAKAIVHGTTSELLSLNSFSVDHSNEPTGPYLYPWGFPLLLSPLYFIYGFDLQIFKIYIILFFVASLSVIFYLFKEKLSSFSSLLLILIFAINPIFFNYSNIIQSDVPFLFFSLLSLFIIQESIINLKYQKYALVINILLGLSLFMAYFIRSNGIVFLPLLLICQLITFLMHYKRSWQFRSLRSYYLIVLPYVVFILLFFFSNIFFIDGSSSHYDRFEKVDLSSILDNIIYYIKLPAAFFPLSSNILYYFSLPFALLAIFKNYKKDYLYILFTLATIFIYVLWPYTKGIRFIFPILPIYLYFVLKGIIEVEMLIRTPFPMPKKLKLDHIFSLLLIFAFIISNGKRLLNHDKIKIDGPYEGTATEMFDFIKIHTNKEDLIIFRKPRSMMLFSDRLSIRENRISEIREKSPAYFVIDNKWKSDTQEREKIIENDFKEFPVVFENERYRILKIEPNHHLDFKLSTEKNNIKDDGFNKHAILNQNR